MRRILFAICAAALMAAGCNKTLEQEFSVTPTLLEFTGEAGTQTVTVTASDTWALKINGGSWITTSKTYGQSSSTVEVSVAANSPAERAGEIVFSCSGQSIKVTVKQAPGTAEETVEKGEFYPDPASGIEVYPACPNADKPCTIIFKPASDNPLYGYEDELYGHFGVVVDGEWMYVPTDWATTEEKTHFTKVADNHWEFKMEPSVREYFGSGDTPVTKIALIVRTADGNTKSHDEDQFCSVTDDKYQAEEFVPDPLVTKKLPEGVKHGINYNADGSVTFVFYDKDTDGKSHKYCYIVGDWNEWTRKTEGAMYYDGSQGCWWITLDGFEADKEYRFQYRLGNTSGNDTYVSDPYTEIVYDQWNDQYIAGVPAFPAGAKQLVSAFQINRPEYAWKHKDFKVEDKNDLVIYEMLFRDFTTSQDIEGAMAQLDYIEELGVSAVQLMPIQEFDGNLSWGYNPNHWFALDKYYGTREEYKEFIDECHSRGLAVIVDVVYNHATGSHPWAKMWWAGDRTAANNPWFNEYAKHPYNVYHDMNHENAMVKEHVKRSLEYLLTEYDVDGFRFDLTKGFTQKDTGGDNGDVAAWGRYDQSRVDILKGYADHIWSVNSDAVVIFEHLSDWDEEKILAEYGIQLWRNVNHEYRSAVAGGSGNFGNMYSNAPFGGFVGYMESHDEERICYGAGADASSVTWGICGTLTNWSSDITLAADGAFFSAKNVTFKADDMFKIRKVGEWNDAFNYGASTKGDKLPLNTEYELTLGSGSQDMAVPAAGTYDVYFSLAAEKVWLMEAGKRPADPSVTPGGAAEDPLTVAMRRAGASAAFFLTVPGPKMIWQFGEIGYDISIEHNGRTGEKPVKTDEYMAVPARKALYDTYSTLLKFRRENPRFFDSDASFTWTPTGNLKKITCTADGKSFHVVGNFGKGQTTYTVPSGTWTDYINGGTVSGNITLKEGEFRLLTK
ncbi:MAG: alpha-amylase [Bacteroidales bacterium]|nr:alpha-amylase [Bacteroidales bacterium]